MKELNASSVAYADLQKKVDALNTKDQAKFADGLKGIADELNKISTNGDQAQKKLESGEVGTAMAKQKGCQKPTASAAPSAASSKDAKPSTEATPSKEASASPSKKS